MKLKKIFAMALILAAANLNAAFVNDPAPDFTLNNLEGKPVSLTDFKGRVVLINFWASWCPPCKKEFPELHALAQEMAGKPFSLVAINLDKSQNRVEKFLEKFQPVSKTMTILLDPDQKTVAAYVARSMPSSFIIDASGTIRYVHFGFSDQDPPKWRKEINDLLSSVPSTIKNNGKK